MKRKLNKAAELERRKRDAEKEEDEEEDEVLRGPEEEEEQEQEAAAEEHASEAESEEDEESGDDGSEAASENEAGESPRKKVKGVLSAKDEEIMKKRTAEQHRIDNIVPYRNKQRVLIFCSRGVTSRFRHLMEDMRALLPHHRKEVKHDTKRNLFEINDLCDMKACNNCMFFEARKSKDLYMWLSKSPSGPSVKFHVLNIHTMDELRLSGNCLKGSRPFLSFGSEFDRAPALRLVKELFTQIFGTPAGHPKSKPFVDHVMTFTILDGKIWFRHYQVTDTTQDAVEIRRALKRGEETIKLVEIGPRFVLNLIKVFEDGFGGRTLVENPEYQSPNEQRSVASKKRGSAYAQRRKAKTERVERSKNALPPADPVKDVFRS